MASAPPQLAAKSRRIPSVLFETGLSSAPLHATGRDMAAVAALPSCVVSKHEKKDEPPIMCILKEMHNSCTESADAAVEIE